MGDHLSRKTAFLPIFMLGGFIVVQSPVLTQETSAGPGLKTATKTSAPLLNSERTDARADRLGMTLKHFRTIGDLENASRLFHRLFPSETVADRGAALKTAEVPVSAKVDSCPVSAKKTPADSGGIPVFYTAEHEKNPSADLLSSDGGKLDIFIAAEQWSSGHPKDIRIRKSSDGGMTWPSTCVIGDGRPSTQPSLRRVSSGDLGVVFVRQWDDMDQDVYFTRLSGDLALGTEIPVAGSRLAQDNPSLASDYPDYAAPYVYVVYAEHEGAAHSIKFRVSQDLGTSWSRAVTIASFFGRGEGGGQTAIVYDPEWSALRVAYTCPQGRSLGIAVSSSLNFGATWSRPVFVSPRDDRADSLPKIAATGGMILVAYDQGAGLSGRNIGLAYSTSGGRDWVTGASLALSAADESCPDLRVSEMPGSRRVFASYVKDNAEVVTVSCDASDPRFWTAETTVQYGSSVIDGGPVAIVPMADPQGEDSAGVVWSTRNTDYDVYFGSAWLQDDQASAGGLSLTPAGGFNSYGPAGGPFIPSRVTYTLRNIGGAVLKWTAAKASAWITLSATAGTLAPGESTAVEVSINDNAKSLPSAAYGDIVTFTNATAGRTAARNVSLPVGFESGLAVTPSNRDVSSAAGTTTFAVSRTGSGRVDWTASVTSGGSWLSIQSGASGTDAGTITAAYLENTVTTARTGTILVAAVGPGISPVAVTVTQAGAPLLSVTPADGLTSTGIAGGPFSPSSKAYTLRNSGGTRINWTAAKTQTWTTLSGASGALNPGGSATVTVSINSGANALPAGSYNDTVTFVNTTNGSGNTTRPVSLTVTGLAGALSVTPADGLTSTGIVGGPFSPSNKAYTLQNTGGSAFAWTAAKTQAWTTLSATGGTLNPGASATVTVSINSGADALAAGSYNDTVTFVNTTNGSGNTTRPVSLTVNTPPGVLAVTPADGLTSVGIEGGPFSPASRDYVLQNTGGTAITWTAAKTQAWTTLSAVSGTLNPGGSATVTVSINTGANALAPGSYNDTVSFVNSTNGTGSTTRPVSLTVSLGPSLSVTPANRDVAVSAGTTTFDVSNTGGGTMNWTAAVLAGGDWLSLQSGASGTNAGTVTVSFMANQTVSPRQGIIIVTAAGGSGSPKLATVTQTHGALALSLSAQRLIEKAWIIQREYGKLAVTVTNPASIIVNTFVIYRKAGSQPFQVLQQVAGASVAGSLWTYNDTFLDKGTSYTYKIVALDVLGKVISESNETTI
jgi:hypothetical protein